MSDNEFICAICGGKFKSKNSMEQAWKDMGKRFGDVPIEETSSVCPDCAAKIESWLLTKN